MFPNLEIIWARHPGLSLLLIADLVADCGPRQCLEEFMPGVGAEIDAVWEAHRGPGFVSRMKRL